jgi:3-deoxy-D-manno-octulosonate 8-phosphate phosphatase (KDO 8-P phosphatase)
MNALKQKVERIKLIIADVDGVLTDGSIYKGADGVEYKRFSVTDGTGVALAREAGFQIAFISGRFSAATEARARELKIRDVYNGTLNKLIPYEALKTKYELDDNEIAYIGDDLIDIPVMEKVGIPISVPNACQEAKTASVYITPSRGGSGAFREAIDWILQSRGDYETVLTRLREKVLQSK